MIPRLIKLGIQDLWFSKRSICWLLLFLTLALVGITLSISFKFSVARAVQQQAKAILSADISLTSLSPFSEEENRFVDMKLDSKAQTQTIEFRSMVTSRSASLLAEIRAVDSAYPLLGEIQTASEPVRVEENLKAYVYPEVLAQLQAKVGDSLKIGNLSFIIADTIQDDPGGATRVFAFAPRIYIHFNYAEKTGLLIPGSQIFYRSFYLSEKAADPLVIKELTETLKEKDVFISTPEDSLDIMKRFFGVFEKSLHLLSLSVVLLSLLVAFYLFQIFIRERLSQMALLRSLGLQPHHLAAYLLFETTFLSFISLAIALLVCPPALQLGSAWIREQGFSDFVWNIGPTEAFFTLVSSLVLSILFVLPSVRDIQRAKANELFGEGALSAQRTEFSVRRLLPLILGLFALTIWLTESILFSAIISLATLALSALCLAAFRLNVSLLKRLSPHGFLKIAIDNLSKPRFATSISFLTLVFVSFILQFIPHLKASLEGELKSNRIKELPALFVFNIPEEETAPLVSYLKEHGAEAKYLSPMVPARLLKINELDPEEDRFRKFPVRLSYRADFLPSEKIVAGQPWKPRRGTETTAQISLEKEFADRSKIKLGDRLLFDVLGITVEGVVVSIREVDWLQFHPSFFIQFEPGFLEDAPKTFISSVYFEKGTDSTDLLLKTVEKFPTLSVLDVRRSIDRILKIIDRMSLSLQTASLLSIFLCLVSFLSLLIFSLKNRHYEVSIMRALGATRATISKILMTEYLLLSFVASLVGFATSVLAATTVIWYALGLRPSFDWATALITIFLLSLVSTLIARLAITNLPQR